MVSTLDVQVGTPSLKASKQVRYAYMLVRCMYSVCLGLECLGFGLSYLLGLVTWGFVGPCENICFGLGRS